MLLTISTTHRPASDLGYLLHKNPARSQSFALSFGQAHVFYPEASEERCSVALLLEVDSVGLVRRRGPAGEGGALAQYVNDRPWVASSFISVALAEIFGTALAGRCRERPELVGQPLPLTATLAAVPCRGGEAFLRRLFEPLGYRLEVEGETLDENFPEWGASPYFKITLEQTIPLRELLAHLYVLIPVLDNEKHYWVGDDEVEKLLRHGEGWLPAHPERETITRRYLKHQRDLVGDALARLTHDEPDSPRTVREQAEVEARLEKAMGLNEQRLAAVCAAIKETGARRVLDLGCGEGQLLRELLPDMSLEEIVGLDVSHRALEMAHRRLELDRLPALQRARVRLLHGSLVYRDRRLAGFDAAAVVEVIEHLDPPRLAAFERVIFEQARPAAVILTTPNAEYNRQWPTLPAGRFRHQDHRFEWTRAEFQSWAEGVAQRFGYQVSFRPVGPEDSATGAPTQMAIFSLVIS